jgi:hypothetical protein
MPTIYSPSKNVPWYYDGWRVYSVRALSILRSKADWRFHSPKPKEEPTGRCRLVTNDIMRIVGCWLAKTIVTLLKLDGDAQCLIFDMYVSYESGRA